MIIMVLVDTIIYSIFVSVCLTLHINIMILLTIYADFDFSIEIILFNFVKFNMRQIINWYSIAIIL